MQKLFSGGTMPVIVDDEAEKPVRRAAPRQTVAAAPPPSPVREEKKTPFVMEIIQGGKKTESTFTDGAGEARQ